MTTNRGLGPFSRYSAAGNDSALPAPTIERLVEVYALTEEEIAIAEDLTEEELAIFDLLTKPDPKLSKKEELQVKKVGKELLETLKKEKLVLDWRKRQQSRAAVRLRIEETLDNLPPVYVRDVYDRKCEAIYQHVYDSYFGPGQNVYTTAA